MSLHLCALSLAAVLLTYHQITTWFPLYPWNDVEKYTAKEMLLEAAWNGSLMGTALVCILAGNTGFTHWFPLIYYPFLLLGECLDWWFPYFSPAFAKGRNAWDYDAKFSRTTKLIAHQPGRRTPDANHIVLHLLSVATLVVAYYDRFNYLR